MSEILKDIGLKNTASIAVREKGCFRIIPVPGCTHPREYYTPAGIEGDYRKLIKEYGSNNVKIFREIQVVLLDEKSAAREAAKEVD